MHNHQKIKTKAAFLLRVGKTKELENDYKNNIIRFACAANWIQYHLIEKNCSIGDISEGRFARISNDEFYRLRNNGQFGQNVFWVPLGNGDFYLYYHPTILIPTLCFYNLEPHLQRILTKPYDDCPISSNGNIATTRETLVFFLKEYAKEMSYANPEECSVLLITNPEKFFVELQEKIPQIIKNNEHLTSEDFKEPFNDKEPIMCLNVQYIKGEDAYYFKPLEYNLSLFSKFKKFERQSEMRIIIPNIRFKHFLKAPFSSYNYKDNQLEICLPHLKEYSELVNINDFSKLQIIKNKSGYRFRCI